MDPFRDIRIDQKGRRRYGYLSNIVELHPPIFIERGLKFLDPLIEISIQGTCRNPLARLLCYLIDLIQNLGNPLARLG